MDITVIAPRGRFRLDGGLIWSGIVCLDGQPLAIASNEGAGGCNRYDVHPAHRADWAAVERYAVAQYPDRTYEQIDALVGDRWDAAMLAGG